MTAKQIDGVSLDAVRVAPAFGLTEPHFGHLSFGKVIRISSQQVEIPSVQTSVAMSDTIVIGAAPLRILMVDDDLLILMNTVDMLEDLGYNATPATSGAKALDILGAETMFDLLITDYSMPKMTGLQLAMAVRAFLPQLPILLATGYAELPVNSDLVLPRLSKPYLQSDLQSAIMKVVARTGLR